jgi:hypothetical protein
VEDELQSPSTFNIEPEESIINSGESHVDPSKKAKRAMRKKLKQRIAISHLTTEDFEKKDFLGSGNTCILRCYMTVEYCKLIYREVDPHNSV